MKRSITLITLMTSVFYAQASAATFTVINTNDSGAGSLRQAITDANGMAGADTILFAIPGTGQKTITVLSLLPQITETVTINGSNNGNASNRVEVTSDGTLATGLDLESAAASDSAIRNLVVNGFTSRQILSISANNLVVQNCYLNLNPAGTALGSGNGTGIEIFGCSGGMIGGSTPGKGNVMTASFNSAILIEAASTTIEGNLLGLNAAGTAKLGDPQSTISLSNASATIGGTDPAERNVIVGQSAITFGGNPALGRSSGTVEGNFIGTDITGMVALNAGKLGIGVAHSTGVVIKNNVISGNATGVSISSSGTSGSVSDTATVQGNFIGTMADGVTPLGNSGNGVDVFFTSNHLIGGTNPGEGNIIANNGGNGVSIAGGGTSVRVEGNSIFSNGGLGIDLDTAGVSLNDLGDSDTGANNLQNFPRVAMVTATGGNVAISGFLNSRPNTAYRIEFFANDAADPSGFGEGQNFLGSADVTTDGVGNKAFDVSFPFTGLVNVVTATATDPDGNTSEFSHAFGIKLQNISTRLNVLTGENVLIGGFIITGDDSKQVIVRAIGPSLGEAGLSGVLEDTVLELHEADGTVVTNDNWKDTHQAEIEATGLAPSDDLESAIVATLEPGAYTAIVSGKDNTTGIALVEAYDLDQTLGPILANISTRGFVDAGDNVMIGGFIVGPTDSGLADVLIRGIGPSLGAFDIANPLLDPLLELHDSNGATLTTNDNWKDTQQTEIEASGLPPTDDNESAILQTLAPGAYTAILRGVNDTTGVGLVEVYNLANTL